MGVCSMHAYGDFFDVSVLIDTAPPLPQTGSLDEAKRNPGSSVVDEVMQGCSSISLRFIEATFTFSTRQYLCRLV